MKLRAFEILVKPLEFGIDEGFFVEVFVGEFVFLNDFLRNELRFFAGFFAESRVVLANHLLDVLCDFLLNFSVHLQ